MRSEAEIQAALTRARAEEKSRQDQMYEGAEAYGVVSALRFVLGDIDLERLIHDATGGTSGRA